MDKKIKVWLGPDYNNAFEALRKATKNGLVTKRDLLNEAEAALADKFTHWRSGELSPMELDCVIDVAHTHRLAIDYELEIVIRPHVIIGMHGHTDDGKWFASTNEGLVNMNGILEDVWMHQHCRPTNVWVLSCNEDGIVPSPPHGMSVFYRHGICNFLQCGESCLWEEVTS